MSSRSRASIEFDHSDDDDQVGNDAPTSLASTTERPKPTKSVARRLAERFTNARSRSSTLPIRPQLLSGSTESGLRAALLNERLARLHLSDRASVGSNSVVSSPRLDSENSTPRAETPTQSVTPPPPPLASLLCPRCVALARDARYIDQTNDLVAPPDAPPACCTTNSRSSSTTSSAELSPKSPVAASSAPNKEAIARLIAARQKSAVLVEVLGDRKCSYPWHAVYTAVTSGRGGIGDALTRERLWLLQARPVESDSVAPMPPFETLSRTARIPRPVLEQILKDLHRSFREEETAPLVDRRYYLESLYRGLVAHAALRPDIGYVQGMNFLWGILVLTIAKPTSQLVVAEHIVRRVLPYYFTTHELVGALMDGLVLQYYFREQRPRDYAALAARFAQTDVVGAEDDVEEAMHSFFVSFCVRHFSTMFGSALPIPIVLCIWDRVMLRGACELFEFAVRSLHYYVRRVPLERIESSQQIVQMYDELFAATEDQDELYADISRRTRLPLGHILSEDLELRRRCAAGIIFERICAGATPNVH